MTANTVALRNCTELEEYRACVALQKEVWRFADNELVPLRIFSTFAFGCRSSPSWN